MKYTDVIDRHRVLLLDGAMGTEILRRGLTEADFRPPELADQPTALRGNNDLLVLTRPDIITDIHESYLAAGADIISTCTFNSQVVSQADYGTAHLAAHMAREGARLAREAADRYTRLTPSQPRLVAGSVGPTGKMLTMAAGDSGTPSITFDDMVAVFAPQIEALIEGGVDLILLETIFDTLNAKAAIVAARRAIAAAQRPVGLMLSATVADAAGHLLSGQSIEAFVTSVAHATPMSIGLNCSTGAHDMMPHLRSFAAVAPCMVSCHPNAGLPDELGCYADTPEIMAEAMRPMLEESLVNIIGGCCGTTPEHIAAMRRLIDSSTAPVRTYAPWSDGALRLSGTEALTVAKGTFVNVGERCNVAGSRKFLRLIASGARDEALEIARRQVDDGAMVLDINMDDGMLDARTEMSTFVRLIGTDPAVARVPLMIDSSRFEVIEDALRWSQGKCIVNSLSLKEGPDLLIDRARRAAALGAAIVVMAFDEQGQATTLQRRIEVCSRAYNLLTEAGINPNDIIFDPNILTVATGIAEHADYALDFVMACRWIHENLPGARVSGGVSNLSFAFRGNNFVREAMHAVFLYRAIAEGLDMAIINPATSVTYADVPDDLREAIEDVLFGARDADATERLTTLAARYVTNDSPQATQSTEALPATASERLTQALIKGSTATLATDLDEAVADLGSPLAVISGPLMEGMDTVGRLFGEGKMFLPQVVKTARTMRAAVDHLTPLMQQSGAHDATHTRGRIVLATVKGDVHDIGKNIVGVILSCNNYEVIDLGVMVAPEKIVEAAATLHPDFVCLSGLITPSLDEMVTVARMMQQAGLTVPIMVGGATTSPIHTAVRIAPAYTSGLVVHAADASRNPVIAARWADHSQRSTLIDEVRSQQEALRQVHASRSQAKGSDGPADSPIDWSNEHIFEPPFIGMHVHEPIPLSELMPLIEWEYFWHTWRLPPHSDEAAQLRAEAESLIAELANDPAMAVNAMTGWVAARPVDETIVLDEDTKISVPRQRSDRRLSLADMIHPQGDYVGIFAAAVSPAFAERLSRLKSSGDTYAAMLMHTVGDRLAEAASLWLHRRSGAPGIRPAIGYPSLPEQRDMLALDSLAHFDRIGISLTENGAMMPHSAVAGLWIPHSGATYIDARSDS